MLFSPQYGLLLCTLSLPDQCIHTCIYYEHLNVIREIISFMFDLDTHLLPRWLHSNQRLIRIIMYVRRLLEGSMVVKG